MAERRPLSLKHEYELYVEREIEDYKDSIPRDTLLAIGDDAVAALRAQEQYAFDELILWAEVDRIIRKRLKIPSYRTWRQRRLKKMQEYRRPEYWGLLADAPLVRTIQPADEARVLVTGAEHEASALYLAANGYEVTAIEPYEDIVCRVMAAADEAGLTNRVHGFVSSLDQWSPEEPLSAVVCSPRAFAGLTADERTRVINLLQSATLDGGVHLVETIIAGQNVITVSELRARYDGWDISVERGVSDLPTFVARKGVAS